MELVFVTSWVSLIVLKHLSDVDLKWTQFRGVLVVNLNWAKAFFFIHVQQHLAVFSDATLLLIEAVLDLGQLLHSFLLPTSPVVGLRVVRRDWSQAVIIVPACLSAPSR